MHKITNFTGQARHGWERMTPTFGMSRPQPQPQQPPQPQQHQDMFRRPPMPPSAANVDSTVTLSFNIPFSSNLAGPDPEDVLHSTVGAFERWTFPEGTKEGTPTHKLPVHANNVEALRNLCAQISDNSSGRLQATVTSSEQKTVPSLQRRPQGLVTNVCVSGEGETVHKMRAKILRETPIALQCSVVDIDSNLVMDPNSNAVRENVIEHLNAVAHHTGADIFLLSPKSVDTDSAVASSTGGTSPERRLDARLRVAIYSDVESAEHAKTRVLIMIDQILRRVVDAMKLELSMHTLVCGRTRRNIKLIEAATNTAIYFPPPFPRLFGYTPPLAQRRNEDEVYITGETQDQINDAKKKLHELVMRVKMFGKEVVVSSPKLNNILLDSLDKVRTVMEADGTYVRFPQLGSQRSVIGVQGTDCMKVEHTVRQIMNLAGQYYSANWWLMPDNAQGESALVPSPKDIRTMLADICANSGADVSFENLSFTIHGSDDAVKAAMKVIHDIPFANRSRYQVRVKIQLANEHKEFVSGKKNGKINKIMGQSNVQILFDGFNEYDFHIDVRASQYEAADQGLDLLEQEMPAAISFHVPDQYHKRIIGIGGQHIQRIMKKYSVFVKFSNAMERGGRGNEEDDANADNVVCRTPSRNAQSLDLVKQEIMDMVEKVDAEFVSETVAINRLYHRELLARMDEIEELERKWNCKIDFPSTEQASDMVTISGPEYQVPRAIDSVLGMVPENHGISFQSTESLRQFYMSPEFRNETRAQLKDRYEVDVTIDTLPSEDGVAPPEDRVVFNFTRNNAGGVKDAIDFLVSCLVSHGLDATTVKGAIPRPKSDTFEESLPFFDNKVLQHAPPPVAADSPSRPSFADDASDRSSILGRLRKPGSMSSFTSFIGRKNQSCSSPNSSSFFRHASSNASKASLVSMESRDSGYRNPWNDSGVNLPEEDILPAASGWTARFDSKFPFGTAPGDVTPRHDPRASFDSGRPSTSNSTAGFPAPIGPPPVEKPSQRPEKK